MRKILLPSLLVLLILAACRREEPAPPLAPAARTPIATRTAPPPTEPAATATRPSPAATPGVGIGQIDPGAIDWAPQVVYASPLPGEEALLDGAITIRFDQPMDQSSVEQSFAIEPADDRGETVRGTFSWPGAETVVFTPQRKLARSAIYRVLLSTRAAGRNGQRLQEPVELQFETIGALEVAQIIPAGGSEGIRTDASVTVLFNRPVVPLVSTGQQQNLPQPLSLEPAVSGQGEWISTSIYRFTPDDGLMGATDYLVTIPAGLEDVTGGVLEETVTSTFRTLQPSVAEMVPGTGETEVVPTTAMTITFSMAMDHATTEAAVSLSPSAPLTYSWDDDRTLVITPGDMLDIGTRYTLTVSEQARAASGQATLDRTTTSSFTTVPFPQVVRTSPLSGEEAPAYQYGVSVEFSAPIDPATIEQRIEIVPEPADTDYFISGKWVNVDFRMERKTTYRVTIPGDVADPYGNTLGQPYTWEFTTAPLPSLASLNLAPNVSQLHSAPPTTVDVVYRNVSRIDVALYDYDLGVPIGLLLEPYRANEMGVPGPPLREWRLGADSAEDAAGIATIDLGDIPNGIYLLAASAPEVRSEFWQNQRNLLVIADTNIVVKEMFGAVHVWVTGLASGGPAPNRELVLYDINGVEVGRATSDANGFASFSYEPPRDYLPGVVVVTGQPGTINFGAGSSHWAWNASPWEFNINVTSGDEAEEIAYIYTDRPIYRPGDTVHYRGIMRGTNYARYNLPGQESATVRVEYFSYYEPSQQLEEVSLSLDEYGAFSGEFVIPEDAALGEYQIYLPVEGPNENTFRRFTVAEYRRPEFLVTATPALTQTLRGEAVDVAVEARYFFGAPASDLRVDWIVRELPYHLPWDGPPYYSFSDEEFLFYFRGWDTDYYGNYVTEGTGQTDAQGRFVVTLPADLLAEVEDGSRNVTVEATVRDISEFPVSASTQVIYHAADRYVGIAPTGYLQAAGEEANVDLVTVDWSGEPLANQTVEVVFYERDYEQTSATRPGGQDQWEPVDTELARMTVETGGDGTAQAGFVPEVGGTYRAVATVRDDAGHSHTSSTLFWVTSGDFVQWQDNTETKRMELTPDQPSYTVGDTARILVQSPFAGPVQAWLTIERGTLIEQQLVTLQSSSDVIEIPITEAHAPNAYVGVVAIQGTGGEEEFADIRIGIAELVVPPDPFELDVSLSPQSELFGPGDTARYEIRVTDALGQPVETAVSLALVDLAVLTLQADNAPPILDAFYARQPYRSMTGSGLFVGGEGLEVDVPEEVFGMGGGGGGGLDAALNAGLVVEEDDETGVRRDFPDTAYWRASLTTGSNGRATVEIPLPDTLTTWRLHAKAVTTDTKVGQASTDIVTSLPLLVRPITPRFFTVNDTVQIGAIVNNNTGQPLDVSVSLETSGLTIDGSADQVVNVPAGAQRLVRWTVTVLDVPAADLIFRAEGDEYSDATKPSFGEGPDQLIPVYRYDAEDLVGTSGVLEEAGQRVEAFLVPPNVNTRQGSVDVQVTASLAGALLEGVDHLNNLNIDEACAHGVVSQFLPNLALVRAYRDLGLDEPAVGINVDSLINRSISRLAQLQKSGGGWGWCYSQKVDDYLTAYVLYGLYHAGAEGYDLAGIDIQGALRLLTLREAESLATTWGVNRQAWFLYVRSLWDAAEPEDLDVLVDAQRELLDPYARAYLALGYDRLDRNNPNQQALLSDLADDAILSATGAHWENDDEDWRNLATDIRGTAVVIAALARLDPDHAMAPQAVRWLMSARQAGHWQTPFETTWSLIAITDWMVATGELDAAFDYEVRANATVLGEGSYTSDDAVRVDRYSVPLRDVQPDEPAFLIFERGEGPGRLYYTTHMDAFINADAVQPVSRGFTLERAYYDAACDPEEETCEPLTTIEAGQRVRVQLTIVTSNDRTFVRVEDPIPAGAEAIDPGLATSAAGLGGEVQRTDRSRYYYGYWGWWYFNRIEYRDDRVVFFSDFLPAGTYQYSYTLETPIPGDFQVRPAVAYEEFFPEVFGRSAGMTFNIAE